MKLKNATATKDYKIDVLAGLNKYFSNLWGFIECDKSTMRGIKKPDWRTETRFKLDNVTLLRRFLATDKLVGTRFQTNKGSTTNYLMLDIDCHSRYHPYIDFATFKRLLEAMEDAGLVDSVLVRSSDNHGLHVYFPLSRDIPVFTAACWLEAIVMKAGFKVESGQLECFPNTKRHGGKKKIVNYNAHRLPLQPDSGSVLLDDELNVISHSFLDFIAQMDFVATYKNIIDESLEIDALTAREAITMQRICKGKNAKSVIAEWKADLEFYHEIGWTGAGQTNNLLCKFATYGRVFLRLEHEDLARYVSETARNAPGYTEHCNHKHEIERRSMERANGAMQYYWKLGDMPTRQTTFRNMKGEELENVHNGNEAKAYYAVERLENAIAFIKKANLPIPKNISDFATLIIDTSKILCGIGIGRATLQKDTVKPIWFTVHAALLAAQIGVAPVAEAAPPEPTEIPSLISSEIEISQPEIVTPDPEIQEDLADDTEVEITPPEIAENPIQPGLFRPLDKEPEPETPKSAENKACSDLALYEGFEADESADPKKLKNSSLLLVNSSTVSLQAVSQTFASSGQCSQPIL
ncbi:MAG: hypothetical protein ABG776_13870, partial [Cyanobacteria bacterium J06555_13]